MIKKNIEILGSILNRDFKFSKEMGDEISQIFETFLGILPDEEAKYYSRFKHACFQGYISNIQVIQQSIYSIERNSYIKFRCISK